jgi:hypothetical protein
MAGSLNLSAWKYLLNVPEQDIDILSHLSMNRAALASKRE